MLCDRARVLARSDRPETIVSCFVIVTAITALIVRFGWAPFVLVGVSSPSVMFAVLILAAIMLAAALQAKASGRPF
jgi:hypothetical protein